jgi:DNA-binding NtrC family response regulator
MSKNSKATIMVVDDDLKIVKALALRLNAAGYETITTFNGANALILAHLYKPDLIISDMWMPEGSGLSMAYRIKEQLPGTPLIFLTASKQSGLEEKAKHLGASGYLEKPYEPGELLQMVSRLLGTDLQAEEEAANLAEASVG